MRALGLLLAIVISLLSIPATPEFAVAAHKACDARQKVLEFLLKKYGERPVGIGLVPNQTAVELLVSPNGTFTIIATSPKGLSCLIAAGEAWEFVPAKPGEREG